MSDQPFDGIRFSIDRRVLDGTAAVDELRSLVSAPNFSHLLAERLRPGEAVTGLPGGEELKDAAQVIDLDGIYRFELLANGDQTGTMLTSPDEVLDAFLAWATQRPGWADAHDWD